MMWRALPERARIEGTRAIQGLFDGVRNQFARSPAPDLYVVHGSSPRRPDEPVWWSRADPGADYETADAASSVVATTPSASFTASDAEVTKSLERIAETIDRLAAQLDAAHTERADHLDAIEFLLREMVLGGAASSHPIVLGAIADRDAIAAASSEISLLTDGFPLEVDTAVEVRSRFHDRWICGFAIAEAIESTAGPCRYRLTRRSDGIPLPILFDAHDVRAASAYERQPAAD
jgi:hypothetical protein